MARVPVVYTEHNKQDHYHGLTKWANLVTWHLNAYAVAVSSDVEGSIRKHIRSRVPVRTVLNGVDVERFARPRFEGQEVRARYGIDDGIPVVGTVAVFREQKRLRDWIDAARRVHERARGVRFLLVGDGPTRPEVEAAITEAGLGGIVQLCGLQEDVRPFLAAMDVYMMSSKFEGLPIALLEAMAMRCVPVSTRVGGIPEVVRDGENGLLTDPHAPEQLADAVAELIADPQRLACMATAARTTVEDEFSIRRMTRELESIYLEVLDRAETGQGSLARTTMPVSRTGRALGT